MDDPKNGPAEASSASNPPVAVATQRRHRVLLVDDKADIRLLLATRMELDPNLEVVGEAGTGAEAISLMRKQQPDAIILDLEMPVMDGYAAIPILRTIDPLTRIVVYSGFADATDDKLVGAAKPDGHVVKGSDLQVLMQELTALLAEKPNDVVAADLGVVPLQQAINAFDGWVGLCIRIREATAKALAAESENETKHRESDLMALVGIFISMGDALLRAAQARAPEVHLHFKTRRNVGQAARRELSIIDADDAVRFNRDWKYETPAAAEEALKQLRQRLLDRLPVG